ncbi:MAG: nuclear transport factor 2 family protein [Chloroflexi bacterium]|nr:MAG: nuclear transport factor 2 family protein [Chloroflexota bacterium]
MTIRELVEQGNRAFNAHDRAASEALTADDAVIEAPSNMTVRGKAACVDFQASWWEGFPDASVTIQRTYYDGEVAIQEGTFKGTQTGVFKTPMGDVPPSGRSVVGLYINVIEARNGKLVRQRLLFDRLDLLEQLGLVPSAAATA